jgi:hypothetical protein
LDADTEFEDDVDSDGDASEHEPFDLAQHYEGLRVRFPSLIGYDFEFVNVGLYRQFNDYLQEFAYYGSDYDPWDHLAEGTELQPQSALGLGDDLASIYDWLKRSLLVWQHDSDDAMKESLGRWRFDFDAHSGGHLVNALRAIYYLLHWHQPDESDD